MEILIVGGGKMGRFLAKEFLEKGYGVTLIEQDIKKCHLMDSNETFNMVHGDGSEAEVLKKAGIEEASVVLAVTDDDHDNLAICQLAERQFNIPRTFTAVNTPGNEKLFEWLGVNVAVSSASILAALVEKDVTLDDFTSLLNLQLGDLQMVEVKIKTNAPVLGQKVKNIDLPMESILVTILRGEEAIVPRGNTTLMENDIILALTNHDAEKDLVHKLNGGYVHEEKQ